MKKLFMLVLLVSLSMNVVLFYQSATSKHQVIYGTYRDAKNHAYQLAIDQEHYVTFYNQNEIVFEGTLQDMKSKHQYFIEDEEIHYLSFQEQKVTFGMYHPDLEEHIAFTLDKVAALPVYR